jgi:hypothetical protein
LKSTPAVIVLVYIKRSTLNDSLTFSKAYFLISHIRWPSNSYNSSPVNNATLYYSEIILICYAIVYASYFTVIIHTTRLPSCNLLVISYKISS